MSQTQTKKTNKADAVSPPRPLDVTSKDVASPLPPPIPKKGDPSSRRVLIVTHQIPYKCSLNPKSSEYHPTATATATASASASVRPVPPPAASTAPVAAAVRPVPPSAASTASAGAAVRPIPPSAAASASVHPVPPSAAASTSASSSSSNRKRRNSTTVIESPLWRFSARHDHSAMYSGVGSLASQWETVHIGWTGVIESRSGGKTVSLSHDKLQPLAKAELEKTLWDQDRIVPVFLGDNESNGHYEGFSKSVLWPLFHYIIWDNATDGRMERKFWNDYLVVNQAYAKVIAAQYQTGDLIWIHDYHLLVLPQLVRKLIPDATIGLFVHAPFPSSEIFRCLPQRNELLEGMLGANQIGFQTYSYSRHFISSCTRVLGLESTHKGVDARGRLVAVGTFPIGIDNTRVEEHLSLPGVKPKMEKFRQIYAGKKIIVGRDKLDLVKGVLQKLESFEKFLIEYPEWRNKVVLVQVTSPALQDSVKLGRKVTELVAHINGTYGSLGFAPVHHYHQEIDRDEYYALLSIADMALITSVRDGMNTTSLEYIMCQKENKGPLVLSEFTGTAGSLSGAIMVNPWDYVGVARAINEGLTLASEERAQRFKQLFEHVKSHTAAYWAESFVQQMKSNIGLDNQSHATPLLDIGKCVNKYKSSKKRLMFFDYDGTLTPIVKNPQGALPPPKMLEGLQKLCKDPNNIVWVVSGRKQDALEEWLGKITGLGLSAEHGCFMRHPASKKWLDLTKDLDMSWMKTVAEIFNYYTERTQGSTIEEKLSSITWHYRNADPEYGIFQAKECHNHLEHAILSKLPVEILVGKKNLEVRPTAVNKGEIVKRIMAANSDAKFVICAGDDKTDEDMFRALQKSDLTEDQIFAITVGPSDKKTFANWHVLESENIVDVISTLAGI